MGQRSRILTQLLGFDGYRVEHYRLILDDGCDWLSIDSRPPPADAKLILRVTSRWQRRCSTCGARCDKIHEHLEPRRWRDLPMGTHPVEIEYAACRVYCQSCRNAVVEAVPWADRYQRQTRRFQQMVALEALSMPVVHVAAKHALSWKTVHRIEFDAIGRWEQSRQTPPLRRVGIDEKYRGRKTRGFVTIVSNLDTGEPIWMADGRSIETVQSWIATLSDKEKAGITLFAMDMFDAFVAAIRSEPAFKNVPIVHDAFHVIKRAGEAIDELRRSVFFRAGDEMRRIGRGKRWLLLRPWESCTPSQQLELTSLLACNRTLARAYQFREQLRDLLCNATNNPEYFRVGFECLLRRIQRRDCKPLRKLHDTLRAKRDELAALVTHRPPTGRIEALNTSWEALVRRARGARDAQYLLRRLRFMVANPIRHERDVRRFLALDIAAPTSAAA